MHIKYEHIKHVAPLRDNILEFYSIFFIQQQNMSQNRNLRRRIIQNIFSPTTQKMGPR